MQLGQDLLIRHPALGQLGFSVTEVVLGEIEERVFARQVGLKAIKLGYELLIGRDTAAAIHGAAAVGHLDVLRISRGRVFAVIVIEERNIAVIALDQPAAGRVIFRRGQSQPRVFRERINGLDQALAKGIVA